jgi:hypothetical protein
MTEETMRFTTVLQRHGQTVTGFELPDSLIEELGGGRRPKVTVTVNGHTWRTSIAAMGGRYLLGVSAANRAGAAIGAGDTCEVDLALDTAPRVVEVPEDLAAALDGMPGARAAWDRLSYSHQRAHVEPVLAAKKPETRTARIAKTVEVLTGPG